MSSLSSLLLTWSPWESNKTCVQERDMEGVCQCPQA